MQYFCGFDSYTATPPFDASLMVHFRKRIPAEMVMQITEEVFAREAMQGMGAPEEAARELEEEPEETPEEPAENGIPVKEPENSASGEREASNKGILILDATCCPQDIRYPTDIGLLNQAREISEEIIDKLYGTVMEQYMIKPRTYRQIARRDYLAYSKKSKHTAKSIRKHLRKQLQYAARNLRYIAELISKGAPLTVLSHQLYKKLLVISEVYRQQKEMYDTKTNRVDGRIVSISQPHIRPIVRGKDHSPTEFGAKVALALVGGYAFITEIAWENIAEASLLTQAAEQYKRMFGFYPKVIIGDRVYANRENREWCKERYIRLSGPRLGRKNEEIRREEAKQIYEDSCERNAIEGKFGETKRKYSLDLVMAKLPNTSCTAIAMGFFVANMERKLRMLFAPEISSFVFYDFDLLSLVILAD